ncbi:hypothetical protein [Rhodococcus sp. KRD162]|uniref:hypothetical protein n=1 Tax=unclassified Rhodococcus (in: high G+C Gram-positive bacteria) TaxID=192944 RepID=UPI0019D2AF04|nr:hypothetical protein [Rhodococcus sp. KRD162]
MIYLLALIGLVAVVVLFWKAFGPGTGAEPPRTVGPDDDPEFLWRINREARRGGKDGTTEAGTEPTE